MIWEFILALFHEVNRVCLQVILLSGWAVGREGAVVVDGAGFVVGRGDAMGAGGIGRGEEGGCVEGGRGGTGLADGAEGFCVGEGRGMG